MAAKNQQNTARVPEGFRRVGSVTSAKWFAAQVGNRLHGILENVYERKDDKSPTGMSKFFQLKLLESCKVTEGRGEDRKITTANAGEYVNLNYGPKTKTLEAFVPEILAGAEYEVIAIVEGEKIKIGAGKSMWPLDVHVMKTKAATVQTESPDFDGSDELDEEIA